jgi:hypothetical protein
MMKRKGLFPLSRERPSQVARKLSDRPVNIKLDVQVFYS